MTFSKAWRAAIGEWLWQARGLRLKHPEAPVLRIVKPCTRCAITEVDPATGRHAAGVLQVLATFRADPKLGGAPTFGQNAIVAAGLGGRLRVGEVLEGAYRW